MGILDKIFGRDVQNVDTTKPENSDIFKRIVQTQLTRSRQDIKKWRRAISSAESVVRPDRVPLLRIYQDIVLDTHLTAVMESRKNKVLSHGFRVNGADGSEDEEKTAMFQTRWFNRFMSLAMDARFYGFTLIEFDDVVDDAFTGVSSIPREYVCPELGYAKTHVNGGKQLDYTQPPFSDWSLFVGDTHELGLLNKATPLMLYKSLIIGVWSEFNELYGVPLRIGKTNLRNPNQRDNMESLLREMGSSAWALFDEQDDIQIHSGMKDSNEKTFTEFIRIVDEQVSKLVLGNTMTTDNGSSRSQAEVHERMQESLTGADLRWLEYIINDDLFPLMTGVGINMEGFTFTWDLEEKLSTEQQFAIDSKLMEFYNISPEYIEEVYGVPVVEKPAEERTPSPANFTVMNDVASMYKGFFKSKESGQECC